MEINRRFFILLISFFIIRCPSVNFTLQQKDQSSVEKQENRLRTQGNLTFLGFHKLVFQNSIDEAIKLFKKDSLRHKQFRTLLGMLIGYDLLLQETDIVKISAMILKTFNDLWDPYLSYVLIKLYQYKKMAKKTGVNWRQIATKYYSSHKLNPLLYALLMKDSVKPTRLLVLGPISNFPLTAINQKNIGSATRSALLHLKISDNNNFLKYLPKGLYKIEPQLHKNQNFILLVHSFNPISVINNGIKTKIVNTNIISNRYHAVFISGSKTRRSTYVLLAKTFNDPDFEIAFIPVKNKSTKPICSSLSSTWFPIDGYLCAVIGTFLQEQTILNVAKQASSFIPTKIMLAINDWLIHGYKVKKQVLQQFTSAILSMQKPTLAFLGIALVMQESFDSSAYLNYLIQGFNSSNRAWFFAKKIQRFLSKYNFPIKKHVKKRLKFLSAIPSDYEPLTIKPKKNNHFVNDFKLKSDIYKQLEHAELKTKNMVVLNNFLSLFDASEIVRAEQSNLISNSISGLIKSSSTFLYTLALMKGKKPFWYELKTNINKIVALSRLKTSENKSARILINEAVFYKKLIYIHQAVQLIGSQGIKDFGDWSFPDNVRFTKFRCIKKNKLVIYPEVHGVENKIFSFSGLESGDIVEVEYFMKDTRFFADALYDIFNFGNQKYPTLKSCVSILKNRPYILNQQNSWILKKEINGFSVFCTRNVPKQPIEPKTIDPKFILPGIIILPQAKTKKLLKSLSERILVLTRLEEQQAQLWLSKLPKPQNNDFVKQATFYVAQNIEPDGTGLLDNFADSIVSNKKGNRTTALFALFRAAGFQPELLLINGKQHERITNKQFNLNDFNYPVIRIKNNRTSTIIDMNSQIPSINRIAPEVQGRNFYVIKPGIAFKTIESGITPVNKKWQDKFFISVNCDNQCSFLIKGEGKYKILLDKAASSLNNRVLNSLNDIINLENPKITKVIRNNFTTEYIGSSGPLVTNMIKLIDTPNMVMKKFFSEPKRTSPIFVNTDINIEIDINLKHYKLVNFKKISTKKEYFEYRVLANTSSTGVKVIQKFIISPQWVKTDEYVLFKNKLLSVQNLQPIQLDLN